MTEEKARKRKPTRWSAATYEQWREKLAMYPVQLRFAYGFFILYFVAIVAATLFILRDR